MLFQQVRKIEFTFLMFPFQLLISFQYIYQKINPFSIHYHNYNVYHLNEIRWEWNNCTPSTLSQMFFRKHFYQRMPQYERHTNLLQFPAARILYLHLFFRLCHEINCKIITAVFIVDTRTFSSFIVYIFLISTLITVYLKKADDQLFVTIDYRLFNAIISS